MVEAAGLAERADCDIGGDPVGIEAMGEHKIEGLVDGREGGIGCVAGLGE